MRRSVALSVVTCVSVLAIGCLERPGATVGPEIGFGQEVSIGGGGVSAVDVLFVIDDSGSMHEEQTNLAVQIPALVRDLASPPDRDGDGAPDWSPVESLRIAIANTDVGIGSLVIPGSGCNFGGDAGVLHGGVFAWQAGDDPTAFAAQVGSAVEGLGISGCAFEQQLEAAAAAMAGGSALGFPREDALLAVIVVTDEEDCSVENDETFFSSATADTYNVHCTRNADLLTPVSELLAQIRGDRGDDEIVFAAITGVPIDLPAGATPADILAHPDMQYREETRERRGLVPVAACEATGAGGESLGEAAPARRLVQLGAMLPGSVLTTICTEDFGPAIGEIAARIGERVRGLCLVRALPEDESGGVPCQTVVRLPTGDSCGSFGAYALRGVDASGREVCEIAQVERGATSGGWYYDPSDASCPRLVLTEDAQPPLGSGGDGRVLLQRPARARRAVRPRQPVRERLLRPGRADLRPAARGAGRRRPHGG
ncbi:MAG: hypothetical protein M5U28_34010 [Sandaracinaceae bacterium]|nr:hypothetical protein [Sandaracinaceae bacterium]